MIKKLCCLIALFLTATNVASADTRVYPGYVVIFPKDQRVAKNTEILFKSNNYQEKYKSKDVALVMPESQVSSSMTKTKMLTDEDEANCIKLKNLGALECSPNYEFKIVGYEDGDETSQNDLNPQNTTYNDPEYKNQWGLGSNGINAVGANLNEITWNKNVVIAVLDTGVEYTHEDLKDNMWVNPYEIAGNGIDDDGNGYIDDVYGVNFITGTGNPLDDHGHGTHVAGIIGAKANNNKGVAGVAWTTQIMALKFLNSSGSGSLYNAVLAYQYLSDLKSKGVNIKVVNNSWGGSSYTQSLYLAMKTLSDQGVILTVAAGNEASDNDIIGTYPANFDIANLISIASTTSEESFSYFSNIGLGTVHVAAPGSSIYSTYLSNQYKSMSGTSMATPFASGILATYFNNFPNASASDTKLRLLQTARPVSGLEGSIMAGRIVDLKRMLAGTIIPLTSNATYTYEIEKISPIQENPIDDEPIVLSVDELNYYELDLPFNFSLYGKEYSKIYISPNGVVYLGYKPTSSDYANSSTAPLNSIAALHTDLTSKKDGYGVKIKTETDKVTIYWKAKAYTRQFTGVDGDVEIVLVLNASGEIEDYVWFANEETRNAVISSGVTIGIKERGDNVKTFAYNLGDEITNPLAIKYIPDLSIEDGDDDGNKDQTLNPISNYFNIDNIDLYRVENSGKRFNQLAKGRKVYVSVNGIGSGTVRAKFGFPFGLCKETFEIPVTNGYGVRNANLNIPYNFAKRMRVKLVESGLTKERKIAQVKKYQYNQKTSKQKLNKVCKKLTRQLQ